MTQEEIDALINSGNVDAEAAAQAEQSFQATAFSPQFQEFGTADRRSAGDLTTEEARLAMLYDLQLPVSIELGSTNMLIRDILKLSRGSVIEFDKLVSEPVDILVNGKKVAEGEVVVIDKHFGIRITSLVEPGERIKGIRR